MAERTYGNSIHNAIGRQERDKEEVVFDLSLSGLRQEEFEFSSGKYEITILALRKEWNLNY